MTNKLSNETISFLCHPDYWNKPSGEWGVSDWDLYYIKKVPEANKRDSHNSLGAELKILLALLPEKELKYQCACSLKQRLKEADKLQANIDLWNDHMKKLAKSEVNNRVNMRNLENIAITTGISAGIQHFEKYNFQLLTSQQDTSSERVIGCKRKSEGEFPSTPPHKIRTVNMESPQRGLQEYDSDSSCDENSSEFASQSYDLNENSTFDRGLGNYEEGTIIDPELALIETDEEPVPASERPFNEDTWKKWELRSGAVVSDLLTKFARKKGHPLRPEVWGIVRCGFKIAKPKWCNSEDYSEIQQYTRRATISNRSETVSRLLRLKSLEVLEKNIKEIQLVDNISKALEEDNRKLLLEKLKINVIISPLDDHFTNFFIKILSILYQSVFPENSVMQSSVSESDYGGYVIHPSLTTMLFGSEKSLHYRIGEIILSSVKSCRERRKRVTYFEQKADGVFLVRLKKSFIEVGHLEMSGGYGHKDHPRSTWDGCCKLPIGNAYMLEEIGERFRGASCRTFSKMSVFSLHTYENRIELWRMHVPSCGVLQYERTHKATVPICFDEERKYIFDFVVVLWDLKCWLLEAVEIINKLQDEHNDSETVVSNLSGTLPSHPFTPQKDKHKKGIISAYADSDPGSSPIRSNNNKGV